MPGLQSFCVCTAVGLATIYLLQLSWFTAWLVLDERRREAARNSLLPCLVHRQSEAGPSSLTSSRLRLRVFSVYERVTASWLYKAAVLLLAAGGGGLRPFGLEDGSGFAQQVAPDVVGDVGADR